MMSGMTVRTAVTIVTKEVHVMAYAFGASAGAGAEAAAAVTAFL
jgi:hypothetical protein